MAATERSGRRRSYEQDPELVPAHLEFVPTLTRLIARFIDGFAQAKSDADSAPARYPKDGP